MQSGAALLLVCSPGARSGDRLTFPSNEPDDGVGPVTVIDNPAEDTTLTEGDPFVLSGGSLDATGVDTVYFLSSRAGTRTYSPLRRERPGHGALRAGDLHLRQ